MSRLMIPLAVVLLAAGCTHSHLASPRVQSQNLADVYQQQVLDNLAMFIENSQTMPSVGASNNVEHETIADTYAYQSTMEKYRRLSAGPSREELAISQGADPEKILTIRGMFQDAASLFRRDAPAAKIEQQVAAQQVAAQQAAHGVGLATAQRSKADTVTLASHGLASIPAPNYRALYTVSPTGHHRNIQEDTEDAETVSHIASRAPSSKCGCKKCVAQRSAVKAVATDQAEPADIAAQTGKVAQKEEVARKSKPADNACWYAVGRPKDVPADYDGKVGRFRKTRVWVPTSGKAKFDRLVASVMNQRKAMPETQAMPETLSRPEQESVMLAKRATEAKTVVKPQPASYRVVAASIALNRDPLAPGRRTSTAKVNSRTASPSEPAIAEKRHVEEPTAENTSLKFDRERSLQALSAWDSNEEAETVVGKPADAARVAELETQGTRR